MSETGAEACDEKAMARRKRTEGKIDLISVTSSCDTDKNGFLNMQGEINY